MKCNRCNIDMVIETDSQGDYYICPTKNCDTIINLDLTYFDIVIENYSIALRNSKQLYLTTMEPFSWILDNNISYASFFETLTLENIYERVEILINKILKLRSFE